MRGYFSIGIYQSKIESNIGTLWRSAYIFGCNSIFTIGKRYKSQSSNTTKSEKHIPLYHYGDSENFRKSIPTNSKIVFIEQFENAVDLKSFKHPERAIYVLGGEDCGLPDWIMEIPNSGIIRIPTIRDYCLNVAVAGSIVMYDRLTKE